MFHFPNNSVLPSIFTELLRLVPLCCYFLSVCKWQMKRHNATTKNMQSYYRRNNILLKAILREQLNAFRKEKFKKGNAIVC